MLATVISGTKNMVLRDEQGAVGVLRRLLALLRLAFPHWRLRRPGRRAAARGELTLSEDQATELLCRSVDVILDDGFFLRENRVRCIELARGVGAGAKTHFMDVPVDVIRRRLEVRNARLPSHNFAIDPETLRRFLGLFERPSENEGAEMVVASSTAPTARRSTLRGPT